MANLEKQRESAKEPVTMRPRDWFVRPGAELVVRRADAWALLGWYHMTVVKPNQGLRGFLRRLWLRLTGRRLLLLSPWEQIIARKTEIKLEREARAALGRELEAEARGEVADAIVNPEERSRIIT